MENTLPRTITDEEMEQMVKFDLLHLQEEIEDFSNLVYKAGRELARANAYRDTLKEELEITDSSISAMMREEAARNSVKITEAQIKLDIPLHENHIKAFNKYIEAFEWASQVYAFVQSIHSKGEMISNSVKLASSGLIDVNDTSSLNRRKEEIRKSKAS